jgi:AcrR family transcriptional regulator
MQRLVALSIARHHTPDMASTKPASSLRAAARARTGGRSERIVADVLDATAAELARVGYAALRMEDVARSAGVNKTTVYRRWPTKRELVTDMLKRERDRRLPPPNSGSVREDLRLMLSSFVEQGSKPLARVWASELVNPEVQAIIHGFRHECEAEWATIIARGMARGQLPAETSPLLLVELVLGPVVGRLIRGEEKPTDEFCCQIIDHVLAGTQSLAAQRRSAAE